ncbi:intermembrane transport protein PqiB [Oleiagrimonas soli]|uniref:Mammalian cell entry protein n=1 Tax=Oleiagrimonas soli TaxID=1543381 RepID=A0A099CVR2_9GAMM|nr:MlaD family protein [Oleiagrimonas soli]KGI77776.1 mammalian cell entry protein [Oleiagrimonas soli]MBB6183900.1 paraquat-inducible protein B [Oleiagrimonas soli]
MTERESHGDTNDLPAPQIARRRRWQLPLIWLVPVVAAVVGLSLVVHALMSEGPTITISFKTAEGIEPGKTQVKFKNVVIGKVHTVALSKDRGTVLVRVDLEKRYDYFASDGSRFWVVRPRVGLGGVSGLSTLFSGAYIGADTESGDRHEERRRFKGLETPPPLTHGEPGSTFTLDSDDLGSLDIGSPVYFRRIQVGRVVSYRLDEDGKGVQLQVFVDAPYDRYVTDQTRFWNASGVNVAVDAGGLKVNTESLATVVAGGIAFQAPDYVRNDKRATASTHFELFDSRDKAMQPPDGPPLWLHMRFHQSVRGLAKGATVDFEGISIGEVKRISVEYDPVKKRFPVDVTAVIYPQRLGRAHEQFAKRIGDAYEKNPGLGLAVLIKHGLRAQLRSGNLLTGQLYVALDFFPNDPHQELDPKQRPLRVPTVPGSFDRIQEQVAHIADRLDKVPFDRIGQHLDQSLQGIDALLKQLNGKLAPQASETLKQAQTTLRSLDGSLSGDSPLQQNLGQTLLQVQRAARSLRVLTDYLGRHPEALLRGKRNNAPPPEAPPAPASKEKQP